MAQRSIFQRVQSTFSGGYSNYNLWYVSYYVRSVGMTGEPKIFASEEFRDLGVYSEEDKRKEFVKIIKDPNFLAWNYNHNPQSVIQMYKKVKLSDYIDKL